MKNKRKKKKPLPKFFKVFDPKYFMHDFMRVTGIPQVMLYFRCKKIFISKQAKKDSKKLRPYLIIANHHTFADALAIMSALWFRRIPFIIQNQVFEHKSARFLKLFQCIEINRENVEFGTIKKCFEAFNRGHCVGIFPEGRIINEEQIAPFKSGAALIAWKSKVPILPIYVHKRAKWTKRQYLVFGEAIKPESIIEEAIPNVDSFEKLSEHLREKLIELQQHYYQYMENKKQKRRKTNHEQLPSLHEESN